MPVPWLKRTKINEAGLNGRYRHGNTHLIELKNVVKVYKSAAGAFTALKGVNLQVNAGEFVAVIGKSGSGKSTLLNMLTGIDRPSAGEVLVGDTAVHGLTEGKMAVWRGMNVGVVFQFFQLLPTLTVIENVMLPMDFCHKYSLGERRKRAMSLLEEVDLAEQATKLPAALSGGQQQRVAIARALANDPPILVADEPTGNLDSKTAQSIFVLFEKLVNEGKTILMVTHDEGLARQVTRTIFIQDGEIINDLLALNGPGRNGAGLDEDASFVISQEEKAAIRSRVAQILNEPKNAAALLQQEFRSVSSNRVQSEAIYQIILNQVGTKAAEAEQEGHGEEARALWKILAQATEPWVRNE